MEQQILVPLAILKKPITYFSAKILLKVTDVPEPDGNWKLAHTEIPSVEYKLCFYGNGKPTISLRIMFTFTMNICNAY